MINLRLVVLCAVVVCSSSAWAQDVDALIEDLRDDDVKWNAYDAMRRLALLPRPALDELHAALDSDDLQQRQLACHVLWNLYEPYARDHRLPRGDLRWRMVSQGTLTERMIEVTIEGLLDDTIPIEPDGRGMWYANGAMGVHRLARHAQTARAQLEAAVESDDAQQRLLAALALARGGVSESAGVVLPVLLAHLRDNDIPGDARWCVHAIYRLGEAARPELERTRRETDDDQQRRLVTLILAHLDGPARDRAESDRRAAMNTITTSVRDPVLSDPGRYSMGWLRHLPE